MPRISDLSSPDGPDRIARAAERRRSEHARENKSGSAEDSLSISDGARKTEALRSGLLDAASRLPDVRQERVAQARARLEAGEYDSENVRRVVADRLLDQFGL